MEQHKAVKMIIGIVVCALVTVSFLPAVANAQASSNSTISSGTVAYHERDYLFFEHALQRLQLALKGQQDRLALANLSINQTHEWISRLQSEGKDVSALQAAVSVFETQVRAAEAAHNNAQRIADAKIGFDANGKVVDEAQAKQTLQDIRDGMRECRDTVNPAAREFHEAIKAYLQSLRPQQD